MIIWHIFDLKWSDSDLETLNGLSDKLDLDFIDQDCCAIFRTFHILRLTRFHSNRTHWWYFWHIQESNPERRNSCNNSEIFLSLIRLLSFLNKLKFLDRLDIFDKLNFCARLDFSTCSSFLIESIFSTGTIFLKVSINLTSLISSKLKNINNNRDCLKKYRDFKKYPNNRDHHDRRDNL